MNLKKIFSGTAFFTAFVMLLTALFFFGGHRFLRGAWMDRGISAVLSRGTGLKIRLYDVNFPEPKLAARFGILSVLNSEDCSVLFVAGSGRAALLPRSSPNDPSRRLEVRFEDAVIMEDLCRKSPIIDWASKEAFKSPIVLRSVGVVFKKSARRTVARIVSCRSEQLLLKGGVLMDGQKVVKAHLLVLLPEEKFEQIPKEMRARMIRRKGGWRGVRLTYSKNLFTASGDSGPFFQAQWDHGQA